MLSACQLYRLPGLALALNVGFDKGTPAVWIDSLVPVKKGHEKGLALGQLCRYYQAIISNALFVHEGVKTLV